MAEFVNITESEDFLIEYAGCYLGCGRAVWTLEPQMRELRRDKWSTLREKSITALNWKISLSIAGGEKFWDFISYADAVNTATFSSRMFTAGCELKLFPVDPQLEGYCFKRCYLDKIVQKDDEKNCGRCFELVFSCESDLTFNKYFARMSAGARPEAAVETKAVDIVLLQRHLLELLGEKLNLIPGQGITLNFFNAACGLSAMLKLTECKNWQFNSPREFDFTLQCRTAAGEKSDIVQKIYDIALELNGSSLSLENINVRSCRVRTLEFGVLKNSNGSAFCEHTLDFSLTVQ